MQIDGLGFVFDELNRMTGGICAACGAELPSWVTRSRHFTCDDRCHRVWIDRLVAEFGETRVITHGATGKRYLVPTRVILERGITVSDLPNYPEHTT